MLLKHEHAVSLSYVPLSYLPCYPLPDLRDVYLWMDTNSEYILKQKVNIEHLQGTWVNVVSCSSA